MSIRYNFIVLAVNLYSLLRLFLSNLTRLFDLQNLARSFEILQYVAKYFAAIHRNAYVILNLEIYEYEQTEHKLFPKMKTKIHDRL